MFFLYNGSERSNFQKSIFRRYFFNVAARAANIRGKVEIQQEHVIIYKIANFQTSGKNIPCSFYYDDQMIVSTYYKKKNSVLTR